MAEALATIGGGESRVGDARVGLGYIDFLLENARESFQEKVQIVDVVGDNFVAYFFGSKPPIFQYTGTLINSLQDDWRSAFTIIYNDIIRGTELARRKVLVTLSYDNMAVSGALIDMSQMFASNQQTSASFNFSLLVYRIDVQRVIGHEPTQLKTFPSYVKPDAFAIKQFEVPPRTIRAIGIPSTTTVERKKSTSADDGVPKVKMDVTRQTDEILGGAVQVSDQYSRFDEILSGDQSRLVE